MSERVYRKGNPLVLLDGMEIKTTNYEEQQCGFLKTKIKLLHGVEIPHWAYTLRKL